MEQEKSSKQETQVSKLTKLSIYCRRFFTKLAVFISPDTAVCKSHRDVPQNIKLSLSFHGLPKRKRASFQRVFYEAQSNLLAARPSALVLK